MSSRYFDSAKIFKTMKLKWYGNEMPANKIYRNVLNFSSKYGIISNYKRTVKRLMFYVMIIDHMIKNNMNGWGGFPKRTSSISCNILYNNDSYGNILLRVYPKPGTIIGICPHSDIWETFDVSTRKKLGKPFISFLSLMDIYYQLFKFYKLSPKLSSIILLQNKLLDISEDDIKDIYLYLINKYLDINYKRTIKYLIKDNQKFLKNYVKEIFILMDAENNKIIKLKYAPLMSLDNYSFCLVWMLSALLEKLS